MTALPRDRSDDRHGDHPGRLRRLGGRRRGLGVRLGAAGRRRTRSRAIRHAVELGHQLDRHRRDLRPRPLRGGRRPRRSRTSRAADRPLRLHQVRASTPTRPTRCGRRAAYGEPASLRREVEAQPAPAAGRAHRPLPDALAGGGRAPRSRTTGACSCDFAAAGQDRRGRPVATTASTCSSAAEALGHVDSLQPPFSLINRRAGADVIPWCAAHGTGVIVYSPMQSGLLTGSFTRERVAGARPRRLAQRSAEFPGRRPQRGTSPSPTRCSPIAERHGVRRRRGRRRLDAGLARRHRRDRRGAQPRAGRRLDRPRRTLGLDDEDLAEIAAAVERTGAGRARSARPPEPGARALP